MASSGKRKRHDVAYIKWLDHCKTEGDPKGLKPVVRHTLGWVVKETPEYVVLAMDRSKEAREYGFAIIKADILDSFAVSLERIREAF